MGPAINSSSRKLESVSTLFCLVAPTTSTARSPPRVTAVASSRDPSFRPGTERLSA